MPLFGWAGKVSHRTHAILLICVFVATDVAVAAWTSPARAQTIVPDGIGEIWDIHDGAGSGADTGAVKTGGPSSPVDGFGHLRVRVTGGGQIAPLRTMRGFRLSHDGAGRFRSRSAVTFGGVQFSRALRVESSSRWLRYVDTLTNASDEARTVQIAFGGSIGATFAAQPRTYAVTASGSGDTILDARDSWFGFAGAPGTTPPSAAGPSGFGPLGVVVGSPDRGPFFGRSDFDPFFNPYVISGAGNTQLALSRSATLAPGQSATLVHFLVKGRRETGAIPAGSEIATVNELTADLAATPPLSDLTTAELCGVRNFDMAKVAPTGFDARTCATLPPAEREPDTPNIAEPTTASPYPVVGKSIAAIQADLEAGRATSEQVTQAYLDRIRAYDVGAFGLHSYIAVAADALEQARTADRARARGQRGPLLGVPVSFKDNYDTFDMPTTAGSRALAGFNPARDSTLVRRVRAKGAVILGKLNMSEWAAGGRGPQSAVGGTTWGPYADLSLTPEISSTGPGAAAAASLTAATFGTDTCRSLITPAGAGSLYSIRNSLGVVSRAGIVPVTRLPDVGGPLTTTVTDLATLLDATVGADPRDPETAIADAHPQNFTRALRPDALRGVRLGIVPQFNNGRTSDDERLIRVYESRFAALRAAGATLVTLDLSPDVVSIALGGSGPRPASMTHRVTNDYLSERPAGQPRSTGDLVASGKLGPRFQDTFAAAAAVPPADDALFVQEAADRASKQRVIEQAMDSANVEAFVYPANINPLPSSDAGAIRPGGACGASAATNLPVVIGPAGATGDGMPVGLQMLGRRFSDDKLVGFMFAYEQQGQARVLPPAVPELPFKAGLAAPPITIQAPPPPDDTPAPPTPATSTTAPQAPFLAAVVSSRKRSTIVRQRRIDLRLVVDRASQVTATARVAAATIGRTSVRYRSAGAKSLRIGLSTLGLRRLRELTTGRQITVGLRVSDSAGQTRTQTARFRLAR